jgi:hypothetical protein
MAQRLLDDFRRGQLGAIALELPPAGRTAGRGRPSGGDGTVLDFAYAGVA